MDAISSMEFDYVASGHYANVVHSSADHKDKPSVQNYQKTSCLFWINICAFIFLSCIVASNVAFEVEEVRKLATQFDLPNKDKKDSQGICFLGKVSLEDPEGYVVEKDIENNVVFVSRNYYSFDKKRHLFRAGSLKSLSGLPPEKISQLQCKGNFKPQDKLVGRSSVNSLKSFLTRRVSTQEHVKRLTKALKALDGDGGSEDDFLTIEHCEDGGEDIAVVQLSEDDQGLAAGQFAAFYQGRRCLGSGVILEAWDDQGFPVCKKALEIARMEDKSKLGKPVKIKVKPETPMEFDNNKGIESSRNLFNGQNGVVENRNTTSQVQEEAIPRFPWNWMHKLSEKWTHCVAGIKFAFDEMPISDV
ncbi:tRNA-5-taurinomethyluridine 2-sulfurtransferase [Citrus sinensis]|uniref:tRNA-5-taurinomethyluridine 2-sulfurtransferase n=1 Tax=Citrus sinensis TaxID=2711 RepID=A0ACB8I0H2_CITSI|nr:tRNA-5-taurinomethyluridine 2-sulfurtransferase [Citrus sinensis]